MPSSGLKLPSAWRSNVVFASDGRRAFGVDGEGALWSVAAPRDPGEHALAAQLERAPGDGSVLAAGWLEGRLATIAWSDGELVLSHGEYGLNGAPSLPARVHLDPTKGPFAPSGRLEPYARWWQEVNPHESILGAISLLRGADERLSAVAAWNEGNAQASNVSLVADRVAALVARDDEHAALFVGEVSTPSPDGVVARVLAGTPAKTRGIFLLNRRQSGRPDLVCALDSKTPLRAHVGSADGERYVLVAVELDKGAWSFFRCDFIRGCDRLPEVASVRSGVVLGTLASRAGPALVVRDDDPRTLLLVGATGPVPFVRSPSPIRDAAVSPATPTVAYTSEDDHLAFAWP